MNRSGSLFQELIAGGNDISVECGRIVIHPRTGESFSSNWMKKHQEILAREILIALNIDAYEYSGYRTKYYGKHGAGGVMLLFINPITDDKSYVIFNADIDRQRTVRTGRKGDKLPGKRFRISKYHSFYKFWKSAGLALPNRLSSFHDYMGNLKGILFRATVTNNRMNKDSLAPLSVSPHVVREAFLPDKSRTTPGQMPDKIQTSLPDKDFRQAHTSCGLQPISDTCAENHGKTIISNREYKGPAVPTPEDKNPEDEDLIIDEWLEPYTSDPLLFGD